MHNTTPLNISISTVARSNNWSDYNNCPLSFFRRCLDVLVVSLRVFFDTQYRMRFRVLCGISSVRDNQCPVIGLLREATGRFMRNCAGGAKGAKDLKELEKKAERELERCGNKAVLVGALEETEKSGGGSRKTVAAML